MKKTFVRRTALGSACALACAAADAQAPSSVQIYGLLVPMIDHVDVSRASSAAPANRPAMLGAAAYNGAGEGRLTRMQSSTANLGLRATEDLGGGLAAFFQLEHGLQVDEGVITGPPGNNRFWNRNSAVGLKGAFGTVFAGIWDTPIAWSHLGLTNGVRNPYAGDSSDIFVTPGFNVPHSVTLDNRVNNPSDAVFNRRQGNSLQYWSPNFSGLSLRLAYSLPEGTKTAANGAGYAPSMAGLGMEYVRGALTVRYAYQRHRDYFGLAWLGPNPAANPDAAGSTAGGSSDSNHRLIVRYAVTPQWTVQGTFDRLSYAADGVAAGAVDAYRRNAWSALVLYRNGRHVAWGDYGRADDGSCSLSGGGACGTSGLGAQKWGLGYRYDFSKRTDVFVSLYGVDNERNGQYGVFPRSRAGIAPGSRQTAMTLGIEHSF